MIKIGHNKVYRLGFCIVLLISTTVTMAQTVEWRLKPSTDYDEITLVGKNLFKVVTGGRIGLINSDGTVVETMDNDALTLFYEDKALLTKSDSHGERITGVLISDGTYHKFNKKYYVLTGQNFFSDDLLTVEDEDFNKGYVNYLGAKVLGFDGKYSKIKPFVKGYASVFKGGKYMLINKEGQVANFVFRNGVGEITRGSNVHPDGRVYVLDGYSRKFYTYNTISKSPLEKASIQKLSSYDYLYRFSEITGATKEVPFKDIPYSGLKGVKPFNDDGKYGYKSEDGVIIVPAQLSKASQFVDDYAVVEINGRKGILKYVDNGTFELSKTGEGQKFYAGDKLTCSFNFRLPPIWRNGNVTVRLLDDSGTAVDYKQDGATYTFSVKPTVTGTKTYQLRVRSEGLLLYEAQLSYQFTKKIRCTECGKDIDACEYKGKHQKTPTVSKSEERCPVCGKKYGECEMDFVHY